MSRLTSSVRRTFSGTAEGTEDLRHVDAYPREKLQVVGRQWGGGSCTADRLFRTNSSGKSSLLQLLLLLKQTIGSEEVLFFGDESSLVNLGSFNEAIFRYNRG